MPELVRHALRRPVVVALSLAVMIGLLALLLWSLRPPFEERLAGVEPSGMRDEAGNEELLVTLCLSNRDTVSVMFDTNSHFEVKVANHWIKLEQEFTFARLAPGQQTSVLLRMPAGTEACRLRLNYQSEIWKQRLIKAIGLKGRTLVAKSPVLCKWVWPDQLRTMPVPPHWRRTTLDIVFPRRGAKSAGSPAY